MVQVGPRINNVPEALCLNDIGPDWRLVARREGRGEWFVWTWLGAMGEEKIIQRESKAGRILTTITSGSERTMFLELAMPPAKGRAPEISLVQGRDDEGTMCLYARKTPIAARGRFA